MLPPLDGEDVAAYAYGVGVGVPVGVGGCGEVLGELLVVCGCVGVDGLVVAGVGVEHCGDGGRDFVCGHCGGLRGDRVVGVGEVVVDGGEVAGRFG